MVSLKNTFFRYLPVSAADKRWGLFVPTAGYIWSEAHMDYPLAQHPTGYHYRWEQGRILQEFQVLYVTRGEGVYESAAAGKRPIKAGDAFIVFPGVWHRYGPNPETGWDECWVGFDGDVARNLIKGRCFCADNPVFSVGLDESWQEPFQRVIELIEMEPLGYAQMLAGLAFQILARLHVSGRVEKVGGDFNEAIIRKAKLLVMEHLSEKVDWELLAHDLHVSYSWLRHTFRQHTGFSLHQYQLQLRLNKAKSLLNSTAHPVKEVAQLTGFDCPYHFSHLFKRKTGLSPEAWRHDARGGGGQK
jgi:AraC-like DNA-binding protein